MQEIDKNLSCTVKGGKEYANFLEFPTGEAFKVPFSMRRKISGEMKELLSMLGSHHQCSLML
eukprot:12513686-Ditylum_brightwellii.AAC.1